MEEKNEESDNQNLSEQIEVQPEEVLSEQIEVPKTTLYPIPLTKIGFFLRGVIAIAIGALMFLYQDSALQILGVLLGCAIIVLSVLNIIIGYRERYREFYAKWLIAGGVIGAIFGLITVFVPLLV
jgi:VIT1/CCC1 family predicted Fe2+/Mn2+ transporter